MTENRHSALPDSSRLAKRTKLVDAWQRQKPTTGGITKKRKGALAEQSPHIRNQATTVQAPGAKKDLKKMSKVEIPVSLDIDPFSTTEPITSPLGTIDELLLAKEGRIGDVTLPESRKSAATPSPQVKLENDTLRRALSEAKAELTAAEERLHKKEVIIKNLADTHVHLDVLNTVVAEKRLLQDKLEDAEKRLHEMGAVIRDRDENIVRLIATLVPREDLEAFVVENQALREGLNVAEERLREANDIIGDRDERIEDLINDRVSRDDLNDVIIENQALQEEIKGLQRELEDKVTLLDECQVLLEDYAAADEA
ncbi:hypothetical protein H4R27_006173 [Coemansia aciculifera]|nr:hypothetical protein H4R27_006173 [Coemansia aciculifera]